MSSASRTPPQLRPLLVGGESLGYAVAKSRTGGPPKWPVALEDAAASINRQARAAIGEINATPNKYLGDNPIVEIRLHHFALAATHYPTELFTKCGFVHLGSYVTHNDVRTMYVALPENGLHTLVDIVSNPRARGVTRRVQKGIRALDSLRVAHAVVRRQTIAEHFDEDLSEVILHGQIGADGSAIAAAAGTIDNVRQIIRAGGGAVEDRWICSSGAMTFIPALLDRATIEDLRKHNGVKAIQSLGTLRELPVGAPTSRLPFTINPNLTLKSKSATAPLRVAVFDGGVDASSPIWQGKVISKQLGTVTGSLTAQRHGALVTSAMLYGHLDGMTLPEPANIEITHYTSIPQAGYEHDVQMYWLLDTMKREIERGDFEVVLLCVGPDLIVADDYVDRWTSVIDQLAFEQDVLFVIAAGNNGALDPGLNRILVPADTANGIAVGASATQHRARRAPYSARGPGRSSYQIRPSGIAFGGSEAERFIAVDNDGEALAFQGTSCAAPLVVHGLAKAAARLGLQYRSALTLRCCAIHFAAPAPKSRSNEEGYGYLPHEYPLLDDTEPNCVHVLYQGEAQRNRIEALPLPLPSCACAPLKLRITLISVSDVNSHDAGDYAGAGFDVTLRPDSRLHSYTLSRPGESEHVVRNVSDDDLERCQELHEKGYRKSGRADSENWTVRNKHENVRRGDGKWESVQVITHGFKKNPHKPVIELEHLSRLDGRLTAEESPLKWTMLVTLQGAANANLYDEVVQEFPTLQPLPEHGPESDGGFVEV